MRKINLLFLFTFVIILLSCSDDNTSITGPSGPDCLVTATTDSSTKYTEITYWNDKVLKFNIYDFANVQIGDLQNSVEYDRNVLGEFKSIKYLDANGNLEVVDSISYNSKGLIYEIITYNSNNERLKRITLNYDNQNNLIEERVFNFDINWIIKIETDYIYDSDNRVVTSVRNQKTSSEDLVDSTFYTYDNMKNVEAITALYTPFKKNNFLTVENVYYLSNAQRFTELETYEHDYNEKGYPIKTKITSSIPENGIKYQYHIMECEE